MIKIRPALPSLMDRIVFWAIVGPLMLVASLTAIWGDEDPQTLSKGQRIVVSIGRTIGSLWPLCAGIIAVFIISLVVVILRERRKHR